MTLPSRLAQGADRRVFCRDCPDSVGRLMHGSHRFAGRTHNFIFTILFQQFFFASKKAQARRQTPKEDNRHAPRRQSTFRASPAGSPGRLRVQSSPQVRFSMPDTTSMQSRRRRVRPRLNIIGELVAVAGWPRLAANRTPRRRKPANNRSNIAVAYVSIAQTCSRGGGSG